jgi:hypothetical protein
VTEPYSEPLAGASGFFIFEPIGRAAGTVGGILPLRHVAFEPHLAGMGEDGRAVAFDMLIEPDAGASLGQDRCERSLANLKRIAPQVVAVQLDQVEGVEKHAVVSAMVTNEIERGNAVVITGDSLAVGDAGTGAQAGERLNDQRKATREVIAGTAIEPHLPVALAGNDAEAIVLDKSGKAMAMRPGPAGLKRQAGTCYQWPLAARTQQLPSGKGLEMISIFPCFCPSPY